MISITREFSSVLKRNITFIEKQQTDKPLYGINIAGSNYMKKYKNTYKNIPYNRSVEPDDIVIDDFLKDLENIILSHEKVGGDLFYPAVPFPFIPWMEAIIGCTIYAGKDSMFAKPFLKNWDAYNWNIDLSNSNKWLLKLLELQESILSLLDDGYPIGSSTHLRGPIDMVSSAIGQTEFCLELYDNSKKVREFSQLCTGAFTDVAKKLNAIASKSKFNGYTLNGYGIWSPYVCQYYQDDALAFISPKIYKDFFLIEHLKIDSSFNSTFFHVHPISSFIIDYLIEFPNLDIIEVNREPMGPSIEEMMPMFKKIQEANKSLLINFTTVDFSIELIEEETRLLKNNLKLGNLCIYICVKDIEDGQRKLKLLNDLFSG